MRKFYLTSYIFFFLLIFLIPTVVYGQNKLHVILVVDNRSADIEQQMDYARDRISSELKHGIKWDRLNLRIVDGDKFLASEIESQIKDAEIHSTDAILFYYIGHGYHEDDVNGIKRLLLPGSGQEPLYIERIIAWLNAKNAKCSVAIFDMCEHHKPDIAVVTSQPIRSPEKTNRIFESLFFSDAAPKMLCLVSSSPGESALSATPTLSGNLMPIPLFTDSFLRISREWADSEKTWEQFKDEIKKQVAEGFRLGSQNGLSLESGQTSQTVLEVEK